MSIGLETQGSVSLTISELASLYGISLRTLRFYESQNLLQPMRVGTRRMYTSRDRARLQLIIAGRRLRFSLREIDAMITSYTKAHEAEPVEMTCLLDKATVEARIEILQGQKADIEASIAELKGSSGPPTGTA